MAVHLRSYHRKVRKFKHHLLDNVKPVSEERANELAAAYLKDRSDANREALILSMLSILRYTVGRYIANFPQTRINLDEMVSEGLLTIVKSVDNLNQDTLQGRSIIKVISQRIVKYIEVMLYEVGCVASPSMRTFETHRALGKETPYITVESDLTHMEVEDPASSDAVNLIDAEDAIDVMASRLQLDADLMKQEFRHLTAEEAGARLGVHHSTILRRRAKLRSLYKVDFGG